MKLIAKYKLTILGIVSGAIIGYGYYYFWGCKTGTCAITSKPVNSTVYGAIMGVLFISSFKKEKSENNNQSENNG